MKYFSQALKTIVFVSLAVLSGISLAQEQLSKFKTGNRVVYEEVQATVISFSEDGSGQLSVSEGDCGDCDTYIFSFGPRVHLNSPLGHYYGLEKLADWSDRSVRVSVIESENRAVAITVLSKY